MVDQEALGLKMSKRVADRDAAHAELLGEALLGQTGARGEASGEDVVA
jgi:hypothetical protein